MNILSIIIPCYNVEKYVGVTVDSLRKQQRQDVEFLFINDGSTDGTSAIIKNFAASDHRVKLIDKQNGGVSSARNTAIEAASGEYIYLLDGDDFLTDNALDNIVKYIERSKCDILLSHLWIVDGAEKRLHKCRIPEGAYTPTELYNARIVFPTVSQNVYKREIISEHHIRFNENIKCGEVYEFTVNFLSHARMAYVADDSFAHYVMRPSSATHKINCEADLSVLNMVASLYQLDKEFTNSPSYHITAFKLVTSFTYTKYLLLGYSTPEIGRAIQIVIRNKSFRQCLKRVAFTSHPCWKERLLACYMLLFERFGFIIAVKIRNLLKVKQHLTINKEQDA